MGGLVEGLEKELDKTPLDWDLRLVLADAYEEFGGLEQGGKWARYYRWTARLHKAPVCVYTVPGDWWWHCFHQDSPPWNEPDIIGWFYYLFYERFIKLCEKEGRNSSSQWSRREIEGCLMEVFEIDLGGNYPAKEEITVERPRPNRISIKPR